MSRYARIFRILFVMLLAITPAFAAGDDKGHSHEEESESGKGLIPELKKAYEDAQFALDKDSDYLKADSIMLAAIEKAESSFDQRAMLEAYINFLNYSYIEVDYDLVKDVVYRTEKTIKSTKDHSLTFRAIKAMTEAYLNQLDAENSLSYALRTTTLASTDPHPKHKAKAFLLAGNAMSLNGHKEDAYDNYLLAAEQIAKMSYPDKAEMNFERDGYLFDFYYQINQFDKALEHKSKQIEYAVNSSKDSLTILELELEKCWIYMEEGSRESVRVKLEEIIDYCEKYEYQYLLHLTLSFYRSLLLEGQELEGFAILFQNRFPEELNTMYDELPSMYCLVKSYIHEFEGDLDSSDHYMALGLTFKEDFGSNIYKANYLKRYGQYLLRTGREEAALDKFRQSFEEASKDNYLKFMLDAATLTEETALELNDYKLAHEFGQHKNKLTIEKALALHEDDLLRMELKSQARQMEYKAEKKAEEKRRKYNIQYAIIMISIAVLFIILVFASSLAVPEWLIEMLGFISILFLFEFILLILAKQIYIFTHGEPLFVFLIKVSILVFLFPLHHLVEHWTTDYMKEHKMVHHINRRAAVRLFYKMWPWLDKKNKHETESE